MFSTLEEVCGSRLSEDFCLADVVFKRVDNGLDFNVGFLKVADF